MSRCQLSTRSCASHARRASKSCSSELGIGFLHVTHGQDEALALADEIVVMNDAVIEQAGPAREVFNAPKTKFVAQFMGGHNVIVLPEGRCGRSTDAVSTPVKDGRVSKPAFWRSSIRETTCLFWQG